MYLREINIIYITFTLPNGGQTKARPKNWVRYMNTSSLWCRNQFISCCCHLFVNFLGLGVYTTDISNRDLWVYTRQFKQAMITLHGMAEHRFCNVYNYQCLKLPMFDNSIVCGWCLRFQHLTLPCYNSKKNVDSICAISYK